MVKSANPTVTDPTINSAFTHNSAGQPAADRSETNQKTQIAKATCHRPIRLRRGSIEATTANP